jgi:hypothetical protein
MKQILIDEDKLRELMAVSELDGNMVGLKGKTIIFVTLELQDQREVTTEWLNDPKLKIKEETVKNLEDSIIEQLRSL